MRCQDAWARTLALFAFAVASLCVPPTSGDQEKACSGNGQIWNVTVPAYTCNNRSVSAEDYAQIITQETTARLRRERLNISAPANSTGSSCNKTEIVASRCICPHDWAGSKCERRRLVSCNLELISPLLQPCKTTNGKDVGDDLLGQLRYDPEYFGVPPCLLMGGSTPESQPLKVKLICAFDDQTERKCNSSSVSEFGFSTDAVCLEDRLFTYFHNSGGRRGGTFLALTENPKIGLRVAVYDMNSLSLLGPGIESGVLDGSAIAESTNR